MYTVILLWHASGCGPLSLNQNKNSFFPDMVYYCPAILD